MKTTSLPALLAALLGALLGALVAAAPPQAQAQAQGTAGIPGYGLGQPSLATAPYTLQDLASLKKALLFTDEDLH